MCCDIKIRLPIKGHPISSRICFAVRDNQLKKCLLRRQRTVRLDMIRIHILGSAISHQKQSLVRSKANTIRKTKPLIDNFFLAFRVDVPNLFISWIRHVNIARVGYHEIVRFEIFRNNLFIRILVIGNNSLLTVLTSVKQAIATKHQPVRAARVFSEYRNLSVLLNPVDSIVRDISKINDAITVGRRALGKLVPLAY